jgi:hypothetical protein
MKRILFDTVYSLPYTQGDVIDRNGYLSLVFAQDIGETELDELVITVTHSDTEGGDFEATTDERLIVGYPRIPVEGSGIVNVNIDLLGCKRYVKITSSAEPTTETETSSAAACTVTLGDAQYLPV